MGFQLKHIKTATSQQEKEIDQPSFLQKEMTFFGRSFSNKIKEDFYTELSMLLKAGITLKDGLELIENTLKKNKPKKILQELSEAIVAGASLSEAVKRHKEFSDYEYFSLKIGEETGTLVQVSEQLGAFFMRKNEQRRQVISAMTYPSIILSTAVLVVGFMLHFIVPMFQDIFEQQNVDLPAITKFIINTSEFMKSYGWLFIVLIFSIFFSRTIFHKKIWYNKAKDIFVSKLPFLGEFIKKVYLSQFTQAVTLLTSSKVPLVNSIQLVKQMIRFYPLQNALETVEQDLLKGKSLSESLKPHALFDDKMVALVKVAEETNQNEFIFERLNTQYNVQVQIKSKLLSTIMEPIIIMFVGVLVGVILIAMYLPMFKLSNVLG